VLVCALKPLTVGWQLKFCYAMHTFVSLCLPFYFASLLVNPYNSAAGAQRSNLSSVISLSSGVLLIVTVSRRCPRSTKAAVSWLSLCISWRKVKKLFCCKCSWTESPAVLVNCCETNVDASICGNPPDTLLFCTLALRLIYYQPPLFPAALLSCRCNDRMT
jgi:hypothetical protein